ncbi:PBAN-type neuropeptides-like [Vanessa atalanta]|uniref:PBAN-type neuropeptides-like n=1 Tax=Vanessa atalanta TaxID=42275 RepID=UPI001FCDC12B|nr:PBAN-type neuropeptides-like [Vanessa atalanta]
MSCFVDVTFIFIVFLSCVHTMAASDIIKDDELDKGAHSERGALWFGPRLGKRSLQFVDEDNSQAILKLLEAADAVKYYYNQMPYEMQADAPQAKVTKKVIFTPKLGRTTDNQEKRFENVEFTPRLGRKLAEKMAATSDDESYYPESVRLNTRSNYFSPRLGRNFNLANKLPRELIYDIYSEPQIRVARSLNRTKSSKL